MNRGIIYYRICDVGVNENGNIIFEVFFSFVSVKYDGEISSSEDELDFSFRNFVE